MICINFTQQLLAPCPNSEISADKRDHMQQLDTSSFASIMPVSFAWFSVLLFDMYYHSDHVKQVLISVVRAKRPLFFTLCFLILMMLTFSFFMFELFSDIVAYHPRHELCSTLWDCTIAFVTTGPRLSGGIGDLLRAYDPDNSGTYKWETVMLFSFCIFLMINLMGLNLLLGIIIDSFAKVRTIRDAKDWDNENLCFICGINRRKFELSPTTTFKRHITKHHNITAYLDFFVHIKEKPRNYLSGLESHVLQCIEQKTIVWFPLEYAGDLDTKAKALDPRDC